MSRPQIFCAAVILIATSTGCGAEQNASVIEVEMTAVARKEMSSLRRTTPIETETELRQRLPGWPNWPLVDGYSNPNLIVYDKARFDRYCAAKRPIVCGLITHRMAIDGRTTSLGAGLDDENSLGRFHLDHLRQFLRTRIAGTTQVYSDDEALKKLASRDIKAPYEHDVCECIGLIRSGGAIEAFPEIESLLFDHEACVQVAAIRALQSFGPAAGASVPKLVDLLETELSRAASEALAAIGPEAVPALTKKAAFGGTDARIHAIEALGLIGPTASPAVDTLIQALHEKKDVRDRSGYISYYSAEALGHIGDRRALPHLRQMTSAKNRDVQFISEAAIREIEGGPRFRRN